MPLIFRAPEVVSEWHSDLSSVLRQKRRVRVKVAALFAPALSSAGRGSHYFKDFKYKL